MPDDGVNLDIAIATYGHTAAVKDGSVPILGVKPNFIEVAPIIGAFRRMVRDVEFNVCEMAPTTYMIARARGAPSSRCRISSCGASTMRASWCVPIPASRCRRTWRAKRSGCAPIR